MNALFSITWAHAFHDDKCKCGTKAKITVQRDSDHSSQYWICDLSPLCTEVPVDEGERSPHFHFMPQVFEFCLLRFIFRLGAVEGRGGQVLPPVEPLAISQGSVNDPRVPEDFPFTLVSGSRPLFKTSPGLLPAPLVTTYHMLLFYLLFTGYTEGWIHNEIYRHI